MGFTHAWHRKFEVVRFQELTPKTGGFMKYHWMVSVIVCVFIFATGCDFLENGRKKTIYE
ncbi:MAG: hypothetical protein A3F89_04940 [Deltaproteobacteria bacterium RIFCSPLOWO2_12_FULL_50_11]|nr:MAG: hypothetical protein A3F89_04940 [Deltaproteobacteria bacterium RIFCSPLOWO2_12_FULL_50_11]